MFWHMGLWDKKFLYSIAVLPLQASIGWHPEPTPRKSPRKVGSEVDGINNLCIIEVVLYWTYKYIQI